MMQLTIQLPDELSDSLAAIAQAKRLSLEEAVVQQLFTAAQDATVRQSALEPRRLGTAQGDFVVLDDFDAPLPAEVLAEFYK
jgi:predicted transcriptional regulator